MKYNWQRSFFNNPYQYLLYSLFAFLIFFPFIKADNLSDLLFLKTFFLIIVLSIIATFNVAMKIKYFLVIIAIFAFILNIISKILNTNNYRFFQGIGQSINFIIMVLAVLIIVRKIFHDQKITGDTLRGGISVYLMFGILWFQMYTMIYTLDSNAFSRSVTSHQLLYFSFVTLTTVGYGDILPINPVVMSLANLEAIVGQLYPAIIIARLVSLYSSSNLK
ncbi:ion channel [Gloeocapsa sp. PCC 73106]|uniref:ion channel n=1 Tax=Gloeocapsa sp. PCC 73106 TaxID=102232 RepID=UPI0002ACB4AF|nr:ion channel [Gloeocapsa sp. PCC 73106]ELS00248.1 Ion channel [Gloeocapsa sp. PCC 73106]